MGHPLRKRPSYFRPIHEAELQHPADVYALCIEARDAGFFPRRLSSADFAALVAAAYRLAPGAPAECFRGLLSARAWQTIAQCDRENRHLWDFEAGGRIRQQDDDRVNRRLRERGLDQLTYF